MSNELTIVEQQNQYISIIQSAVEKGAEIAQIEKLMDLKERFDDRLALKEFNAAMSDFQSELPVIEKGGLVDYTSTKGRTRYQYAKLEDIAQAIKPVLKNNGISYRFAQTQESGVITVKCIITHSGGHTEVNSLSSPPDTSGGKDMLKSIASTISYLRRYTLTGGLGIVVGGEDDDAGGFSEGNPSVSKKVNDAINNIQSSYNNTELNDEKKSKDITVLWTALNQDEQMQVWYILSKDWQNALQPILKYKGQ